jgi:hypothetical protein
MSIKPNITHTRCHINKQQRVWGWRHSQSIQVNVVWKCSIQCMSNMPNKTVFRFVKTHAKENDTQITKQKKTGIFIN